MGNEVDLIKERLDVADVISEYVPLKRAGAHFKGLCPFHQEKTPSFIVSPDKGIWHCFGCGKGGDVFAFLQEIEGVEFPEALKILAERTGVPIRLTSFAQGKEFRNQKQKLLDLLNLAAKFYHTILMQHETGKKAKEYLHERGVKDETMREFEIGYAPMRWDSVQKFLLQKGFTQEAMIQVGLVGKGQGGKLYDRFRGRIIFPVTDAQGRVIAFGGRIVPWHATGEEGKYINSPETALYEKRRTIYNLSRAKASLRHGQAAVVVEGYLDTVMVWQAGVKNVVASSGTAFTADHVQLLARYTQTLHFAFDADAAGEGAALKAAEAALAAGMRVATIVLPAGEDPADVALRQPDEVTTLFSQPRSFIHVLLERLVQTHDPAAREAQLAALLPWLARVRNVVLLGELVREIAQTLTIPETQVMQLVGQARQPAPASAEPGSISATGQGWREAERRLLGLVLVSSEVRRAVWEELRPELFVDEGLRGLYTKVHTLAQDTMHWTEASEAAIVAELPEAQQPQAAVLATLGTEVLTAAEGREVAEAQAMLGQLRRRYLKGRLAEMQAQLSHVPANERTGVLQEFQGLAEELAAASAQEA